MKFLWTTLRVKDMERSLAFYTRCAGLNVAHRIHPNPETDLAFLGSGETTLELYLDKAAPAVPGAGVSIGFAAESLDATIAALAEAGVPVHSGPFQPNPRMRFVFVQDPDGYLVQFVEEK